MRPIGIVLMTAAIFAQDAPGTRELFYFKKAQPAAARAPFGLRYSIVQSMPGGRTAEVDASSAFHQGDRIRMQFTANQDGFLYVVHQGSSGHWTLLFPGNEHEEYRLREMRALQVPQEGEIVFDGRAGTERLFVVGSRVKLDSFENLIPGRKTVLGTISTAILGAMQASGKRDLRVERVAKPARGDGEFATYIVNAAKGQGDTVIADITLQHR